MPVNKAETWRAAGNSNRRDAVDQQHDLAAQFRLESSVKNSRARSRSRIDVQLSAKSILWWNGRIEAHRRRQVAWCCAQGGVPSCRVSADDRDTRLICGTVDVMSMSMLMSTSQFTEC